MRIEIIEFKAWRKIPKLTEHLHHILKPITELRVNNPEEYIDTITQNAQNAWFLVAYNDSIDNWTGIMAVYEDTDLTFSSVLQEMFVYVKQEHRTGSTLIRLLNEAEKLGKEIDAARLVVGSSDADNMVSYAALLVRRGFHVHNISCMKELPCAVVVEE